MKTLKFQITNEVTERPRHPLWTQFQPTGQCEEVNFSIDEYREAIHEFDETCKDEKDNIRTGSWLEYHDRGVLVTLALIEIDEEGYEECLEVLDSYEFTIDDAKKEQEKDE